MCFCDLIYEGEDVLCYECGNPAMSCACVREICEQCRKWIIFCDCGSTHDRVYCTKCNNYHSPGVCKYN